MWPVSGDAHTDDDWEQVVWEGDQGEKEGRECWGQRQEGLQRERAGIIVWPPGERKDSSNQRTRAWGEQRGKEVRQEPKRFTAPGVGLPL